MKEKVLCKECSKMIGHNHIQRHLRIIHEIKDFEKYYLDNLLHTNPICICGNKNNFINIRSGYSKHCSASCAVKHTWINDDKRKLDLSKRFSENNPGTGRPKGSKNVHPYPVTDLVLNRPQNRKGCKGTFNGKKHTRETKERMSQTRLDKIASGEIKIMASYKGKFKPKNPSKYKGDPTNIVYRSSWELSYMMALDNDPSVIQYSSEEVIIPYHSPLDPIGKNRRYFVDFWVKKKTDQGIVEFLVEIKPKKQTTPPAVQNKPTKRYIKEVQTWGVNDAKWQAAEKFAKSRGWDFLILTEDHLNIKQPVKKPWGKTKAMKKPWGKFS